MLWLCGVMLRLNAVPKNEQQKFSSLALPQTSALPCLLVFSTPMHKFAVLCVARPDFEACLLQSNQDMFTGAPDADFTFQQYMLAPRRMTQQQFSTFIQDMQLAEQSPANCQAINQKHFGIPFKHKQGDFWFIQLPVTV